MPELSAPALFFLRVMERRSLGLLFNLEAKTPSPSRNPPPAYFASLPCVRALRLVSPFVVTETPVSKHVFLRELLRTGRGLVMRECESLLQAMRMKSEVPEVSFESPDLEAAVGGIRGKWKVRIICLLFGGTKRFGELRRSLPGVHRGTLTYELRGLEADGIIQRTQYLTIPPTVEYTLTARGSALKPVFIALSRWNQATKEMRAASPTESK